MIARRARRAARSLARWSAGWRLVGVHLDAGAPQSYRAPRTPDGAPDLSGIWQANNAANWDLEAHAAKQGPVFALGAAFSVPPGLGVVGGDGASPTCRRRSTRRRPTARTG